MSGSLRSDFSPGVPNLSDAPGERGSGPVRQLAANGPERPNPVMRILGGARAATRLAAFFAAVAVSLADHIVAVQIGGRRHPAFARARWAQRWARCYLRIFGVEVMVAGEPPECGLLVSNHLSYLDILVLGATQPTVFVAKRELRGWPVIGRVTRCAGTIFIDRTRLRDVRRVVGELPRPVAEGAVVAFFPEGTSTDGRTVLPFYSSLFESAVRHRWPVTGAWIEYSPGGGDGGVHDAVCWWGDADFAPHFWNFLAQRRTRARVAFGPARPAGPDRKKLARQLHARISGLGGVAPCADGTALRAELIAGKCPRAWRQPDHVSGGKLARRATFPR